jgi:uncharacterized SAM-binding protein YcdF (DUF218 family)
VTSVDSKEAARPLGIIVLGCRITRQAGVLVGELGRRTARAAELYAESPAGQVWLVMSGGVAWGGIVEADAMRDEAIRRGVPEARILCERQSKTTRGNARAVRTLLATHNMLESPLRLVTSGWHMQRALGRFHYERLAPEPVAVRAQELSSRPMAIAHALHQGLRERCAQAKEVALDWCLGPSSQ